MMTSVDRILTPQVRRWLYGIAAAVLPLLIAYGVLDDHRAPLWIALVGACLAPGMAWAHTDPSTPSGAPAAEVEARRAIEG